MSSERSGDSNSSNKTNVLIKHQPALDYIIELLKYEYVLILQKILKEIIIDSSYYKCQIQEKGLNSLQDFMNKYPRPKSLNFTFDREISKKMKVLDLGNVGLWKIPESIGVLFNLQTLYINNNSIWELPDTVSNLTKLKNLDLFDNNFRTLPLVVCSLVNLEKLNLTMNYGISISTLPNEFNNLTKLKKLNCDRNKGEPIPEFILNRIPDLVWSHCNEDIFERD